MNQEQRVKFKAKVEELKAMGLSPLAAISAAYAFIEGNEQ
jgi:hypothetical protein